MAEETTETSETTTETTTTLLPVPRIDRALRRAFPSKRVSQGTSVYTAAALEFVLSEIVRVSESKRASMKKPSKAIDRKVLMAAVRMDPNLSRIFRNYSFVPGKPVKIQKFQLLTKADKEAHNAKREAAKEARKAKKAVPGVDEA